MAKETGNDASIVFTSTVDKLVECQYFLAMMLRNYHDPSAFRYNLNAFIQALRNVTFMLQSEDNKPDGFDDWYRGNQAKMRENPLLRNFVQARNVVVKQQMLEAKSKCSLGLFRGRRMKIALKGEVPPCVDTLEYLERAKKFAIGFFIDEKHSAIGEQVGVERTWIVEALGDADVVTHCAEALEAIRSIVEEVVEMAGGQKLNLSVKLPDLKPYTVLLESDVDPSLLDKWGWNG